MKTYIALFRGINVGGRSILPMKELVSILEALAVKTSRPTSKVEMLYCRHEEKDPLRLASQISAEVKKSRGFEPHVMLLDSKEFEKAMAGNPFPEAESEPNTLHLGFLASKPTNPDLKKLESLKTDSERFVLKDSVFYLHAPDGVGRSKLAASSEKLLGVPMTDRNWRTVCKIRDMVKELG